MDQENLRKAADSVRARLRTAIEGMIERHAEQGRAYPKLHNAVFALYAMESFLHAMARSPRGDRFVLKGGNLFRVWEGFDNPRPTTDLDMQCVDDVGNDDGVPDLKADIAAVVSTEEFRQETGLVFDLDSFKLVPIRKGNLIAVRLEGDVQLGPPHLPGSKPTIIPFCLEVSYGEAPRGAVTLENWSSVIPRGQPFGILASRPEWMAAEKFHAVVSRGAANSRLKDYHDLIKLLRNEPFDDQLLHGCIRHVFEELDQAHLVPDRAAGIVTLSPAFATEENEVLWQMRRWPEWEGRPFDPERDPTMSEAIAMVVTGFESRGVLEAPPAATFVAHLADLCRAAEDLQGKAPTPVHAARFASALKGLAASLPSADRAEIPWRWQGATRYAGLPRSTPSNAFDDAMRVAEGMGLTAALERGWNRGRGGGSEAVGRIREFLSSLMSPRDGRGAAPLKKGRPEKTLKDMKAVAASILAETPARCQERSAGGRTASGSRRTKAKGSSAGPEQVMAEGVMMLTQGEPGSHVWFGGLAKVLASVGAPIPTMPGVTLTMPQDDRAPFIWKRIARKNDLNEELASAVAQAREILGLDMDRTSAPGMI